MTSSSTRMINTISTFVLARISAIHGDDNDRTSGSMGQNMGMRFLWRVSESKHTSAWDMSCAKESPRDMRLE